MKHESLAKYNESEQEAVERINDDGLPRRLGRAGIQVDGMNYIIGSGDAVATVTIDKKTTPIKGSLPINM